jgi:hypothetical protein
MVWLAGVVCTISLYGVSAVGGLRAETGALPTRISDEEFWRIVTSFSERAGTFPSDNLLSNETSLQHVIPDLARRVKPGGIYLGVGPEQNFTYMAALRPRMAFVFDIRRGNLALHLIYKALFEMSNDRAEFVSRLFARKQPAGLNRNAPIASIFDAIAKVDSPESLYIENVRAVVNHLTKKHTFVLDAGDLLRLQHDYRAFHLYGPKIQYSSSRNDGRRGGEPTYAELMVATDELGELRGYLASDESFQYLKRLEQDNLLVPLVGNFSGPRAIRAVGQYLKDNGATVSVFYVSNVEEYLRQDGLWGTFCANVASLPLDETSTFIRSLRSRTAEGLFMLNSQLAPIAPEVKDCLTSQ